VRACGAWVWVELDLLVGVGFRFREGGLALDGRPGSSHLVLGD
jgi:hypothetical protein